jgi:hypothetical protein
VGIATGAQWVANVRLYRRLVIACRRAVAVGLPIAAFLWMQGESDHATSQAFYAASPASLIAVPRAAGLLRDFGQQTETVRFLAISLRQNKTPPNGGVLFW